MPESFENSIYIDTMFLMRHLSVSGIQRVIIEPALMPALPFNN